MAKSDEKYDSDNPIQEPPTTLLINAPITELVSNNTQFQPTISQKSIVDKQLEELMNDLDKHKKKIELINHFGVPRLRFSLVNHIKLWNIFTNFTVNFQNLL